MHDMSDDRKALAILAHDLKAPLSAIIDLLGVIEKGYVSDINKTRDLVARASQKAETLIKMVDDILDCAVPSNNSKMKRETLRIFDIVKESIHTVKPFADSRNITLTYHPELWGERFVSGNYTFLLRVFNNILMNAIKYNKEIGQISIDCAEDIESKNISIRIRDTGVGIPEDEIDQVFDVFERGRYAGKNIDGSIGLGLSLVREIVKDHEGKVNLTSKVGEGTTVTITLPYMPRKK